MQACCCPVGGNGVCLDIEITKSALIVIEKYVSWVDIDLVANNEMFGNIINILHFKDVKHQAIDCIHEIIYKGMLPSNKFRTIQVISKALLFNDRYCSGVSFRFVVTVLYSRTCFINSFSDSLFNRNLAQLRKVSSFF